jgi:hypothetical protein
MIFEMRFVYIPGSFKYTFNSSDYVESNDKMNSE